MLKGLYPILLSIVIMVLLTIGAVFFVRSWLNDYTRHGIEIEVPDLKGLYENEAAELLKGRKLAYEIIDSTYAQGYRPGSIVDQVPSAGSNVKEDRKIYLTIQAKEPQKVQLPEVREGSSRQAEATLSGIGIKVDYLEYVPSLQIGNVIEVKYKDKVVPPGTMMVKGDKVTLVIGRGDTNEEAVVISLRGMTLAVAKNNAHENGLNIGTVNYDADLITDAQKENAIVYKQFPITHKTVPAGTRVDLFMTLDRKKLEEPEEVCIDSVATNVSADSNDGLWDN